MSGEISQTGNTDFNEGEINQQQEGGEDNITEHDVALPSLSEGVEDGDSGEEEDYEDAGEDADEDGDENELVILDPNHPLMQRVQDALTAQLTRQNEKLEIELREKCEILKGLQTERENLGIELYSIQQQLARQQMFVEQEQDKHTTTNQLRMHKEEMLTQVRELYRNMQQQSKNEREETLNLRRDVENVTARLHYISDAHETVKNDIALTKRATEKTTSDMTKAQSEKLEQDLYLERLTSQIHDQEEQINLYDAQCSAQAQETKAIKEALIDAAMELETVLLEKKKLLQQWNNTLIGMRRRDEAYAAMLTAMNTQQQQVRSLETEVDNYKKSIISEQEKNEKLTMQLNKINTDITHVKKQIEVSTTKRDQLKAEYMTYTRTLQETEQSLTKATTDCTLKHNELSAVRTQTERESMEKRKLEDGVMEKMMQRLTMDKATQYTKKSVEKVRKRTEELDMTVANVENETSKTLLQLSHVTSHLKRLQQTLDEQNASVQQHNELISQGDGDITKNNALVERKQTQIDQLNKKIDQKMAKLGGGEDLGPLEIKIEGLQKQISDSLFECSQMQQFWLRQQNELVRKTRSSDEQAKAVDSLGKQLLIMDQKKLRTDALLSREEREQARVEHNIASLQKDMIRLNTLVTEKRGEQEKLEQGTVLMENDFIHALKESELESIQLQAKVDQLKEEKERILNSLIEAEQQIMLWDKKIQIAREMREAVDSDVGQAEVRAMKAEIHRMQVRYDQLMRQQEKMIQDMEKTVYRREAIILRGEAQAKSGKKEQTQGHMKKKIADMQRQIKQTSRESSRLEELIHDLSNSQRTMSGEMEKKQADCQQLRITLDSLQLQLANAEENKKRAMSELLSSQAKVKYLTSAKEGKYKMLFKTKDSRETEWHRQKEKLQSLQVIIARLEGDFPTCRTQLRNLFLTLKSRLMESIPEASQRSQKELKVA